MDYVQLLFSFFNAPLFATFLLGMFTMWATLAGGFVGLVSGTFAALLHYIAYHFHWLPYGSDMTANFYGALCAWCVCFLVTAAVSAVTTQSPSLSSWDSCTGRAPEALRAVARVRRVLGFLQASLWRG
jgi:solute:Na+ symporter, SSS family